MRETIHALAHRYHGEWEAMTEALRRGEKPPAIPGDEQFVTWADPHYPARLRQLRFPVQPVRRQRRVRCGGILPHGPC